MKLYYILFAYMFCCVQFVKSLHLKTSQINKINGLIKHSGTTKEQRDKLNRILYLSFEKFAVKKALEFKKKHSHKCYNIKINELIISSKVGLYKGIRNYNGNSNLINYFYIYIHSELLKLLTQHFSNSILSKKERTKSTKTHIFINSENYNNLLYTNLINYDYDKICDVNGDKNKINELNKLNELNKKEDTENIWNIINNFEPFSKRVFLLKYDYDFNVIRSNQRVAILMCCSEEHIRNKLLEKGNYFLLNKHLLTLS